MYLFFRLIFGVALESVVRYGVHVSPKLCASTWSPCVTQNVDPPYGVHASRKMCDPPYATVLWYHPRMCSFPLVWQPRFGFNMQTIANKHTNTHTNALMINWTHMPQAFSLAENSCVIHKINLFWVFSVMGNASWRESRLQEFQASAYGGGVGRVGCNAQM